MVFEKFGRDGVMVTGDSLATMPSGMSFAQKARAAELSAARARRERKEEGVVGGYEDQV